MWLLAFEKGQDIRSALYYFMFAVCWQLVAVVAITWRTELEVLTRRSSLSPESLAAVLGLVLVLGLAVSRRVAGQAPLEHWVKVLSGSEVRNGSDQRRDPTQAC
jgi:hypothetical protein